MQINFYRFLFFYWIFTGFLINPLSSQENNSEFQLKFSFCHCYFDPEELVFTGLVVTPNQQVFQTKLLSANDQEDTLSLPLPNTSGIYTISFYIKDLSPDFELGEFGRVCVTNNLNDEMAYFVAETSCISWKGQQITFQYILVP